MCKWIRFLGCSVSFFVVIACARSGLDQDGVPYPTAGGSSGEIPVESVSCPRGYAGTRCATPVFVAMAVPANHKSCRVNRISGDCSAAVGSCEVGGSYRAMRWDTATGKASTLPSPASTNANASGLNSDGSLIVGNVALAESASPSSGVVWRSTDSEPTMLDQATNISAVSDDGRIAIGRTSEGTAYWDIANLATSGTKPNPIIATTQANWEASFSDLSSDGTVMVGTLSMIPRGRASNQAAIRWTQATGVVPLVPTPNGDVTDTSVRSSGADGVSGDGKVTFGSLIGWYESRSVRWVDAGEFEHLSSEYDPPFYPSDTNFDGSIMVGYQHDSAALWDISGNVQTLEAMLARISVTFPPKPDYHSMSSSAAGICNDGSVLVGNFRDTANGNTPIPWAVHLKGTGLFGL